jgi:hypothetical protein
VKMAVDVRLIQEEKGVLAPITITMITVRFMSVQTGAIALVSVVDVVLVQKWAAGSYLLASALRSERTKH